MSTIFDLVTKINGQWIHLFKYGYMEAPELALLEYDMTDLNNENLDFRNKKLKRIAEKVSLSETGESITWYEEDLKEANITITTINSATSRVVSSATVVVGELLYNQTTGVTVLVTAVAGTTITLAGAGDAAALLLLKTTKQDCSLTLLKNTWDFNLLMLQEKSWKDSLNLSTSVSLLRHL